MLYFLVPIFNEEDNLKTLYENITSVALDYPKFYVFSDDGSTDNTIGLIHDLFKDLKYIILGDGHNYGPGAAFNTGFEWILNNSNDANDKIITLEADNTSDITILPKMLKISELNFDIVLASVYAQGGRFEKTSFIRKLASHVALIIMRYIFNIKVLTISSFYRIYHIGIVKAIKQEYTVIIKEKGFISVVELLIKAIKLDASIIEVPMLLHSDRRKGKSKMKVVKNTIDYIKFLIKSRNII